MISSLGRFESLDSNSIPPLQDEIDYILDTLEILRATNEISNDAFLEAGSIQGGLSLILNLLSQGIPDDEANSQLSRLKNRAESLNQSYPGLDDKIESRR
ncbi:MAG TPA: hypothetical protein QF641_04445 [Candidatus Thalassarchaeaceae archaeon]|jgi:hypothetical protein|nr:hypothetical protein [Candidatus Thalassarchaeaceae archaeon]|tara:strand:- start:116431 stop:116730 length:300 start_codon:yes stop_codon:yes gene_type:complete